MGDGVVALITLTNRAEQRQWLVQFEVDDLTPKERAGSANFTVSMGPLPSGQTLEFSAQASRALKIHALGPFATLPVNPKTAAKKAEDKTARAAVFPEFLAMGLDRSARVMLDHGVTSATSVFTDEMKLSAAEEKAVVGGFVSLLAFFNTAQQTPGLREIVWEIIDLPSVWSLTRSLGKIRPNFNFGVALCGTLDPAGWGLGARPLYQYPFGITLNEKPAVNCAFFVAAPDPPLLTTAGIVGFTAESPSQHDKHMLVQLIAVYRGKAPIAPGAPSAAPAAHP